MKTAQPPGKIDMNYLKSEEVGKVIAKGLAELYIQQPQFPVDFLAKWLLNYSRTQKNVIELDKKLMKKEELIQKQLNEQTQKEKKVHLEQETSQQSQKVEIDFKKKVETEQYHEQLLVKEFCDFLVAQKSVSGVYVGFVDFPRKQFTDNDDDEQAHLDVTQPKVINYIGACSSHRGFMIGKSLPLDQGVTALVFQEPPPPEDNPDNPDQVPVVKSQAVYIPQVTQEPRMVYFQWPKLGAFFAVPLVYNSCLLEQALDAGIDERVKFRKAQLQQQKEREIKENDFQERLRSSQDNQEEFDRIQEEYNTYKAELVDIQEPDFISQKKEFVLCIDTLGQDRTLSEEERKYFEDWTYYYAEQWEEKEKQLLSNDIDFMLNYYEQVSPKEKSETLTLQEEQATDGAGSKFDDLKDKEKEYNYEIQSLKFDKLTQQITDQNLYSEFLALKEMRVFKYPSALSALLLFLGFTKQEIFVEGTNVLDWEKAKGLLNEGLFEKVQLLQIYKKIGGYSHRGAKPQKIPEYAKINRIQKRIEKIDMESIEQYNVCYGKMLKWLIMAINLRRQDIEIRRSKIEQKKALREQKQQEIEKMKEEKDKILEEHKATIPPEEIENFNQEEWETQYDAEHPLPEVPEDVEMDVDEDYEESG